MTSVSRRTFLKRAGAAAVGAVVAPQVLAQEEPKPVAFAKQSFDFLDGTLTFTVANEKGNKNGFDIIFAKLTDDSGKATNGKVTALFDIPEKGVRSVSAHTFDGKRLVDTGSGVIFAWIKKWVGSKWDLSDIKVVLK